MVLRSNLFFILLIIANIQLFGQIPASKVFNKDKQPLVAVNILNTTNGQHTHSDVEGVFNFENIAVGDVLEFSYLGYTTKQVVVEDLSKPLIVILYVASLMLDEVVISNKVNAVNVITNIDIQTNPVSSSQDVLRKVPGLFIGQHAGGGKAEQIFLRGFDIDHGTDVGITVDGLPVNMVSHAHGQGYADLHFVIPETIDKIDFGKGPYYENKGNFNTAGYVDFSTKKKLENSVLKMEAGQFDTYRFMGMLNLLDNDKHNAYLASEYLATNGLLDSPQNFNRLNLFGKYNGNVNSTDRVDITASYFSSKWDASGQIPKRAVNNGLISRFGAIDDTEGGNTSRTNVLINYIKFLDEKSSLENTVFLSQYDFELYSNFTFFLNDTVNGDQIKQKENRTIYGLSSDYKRTFFTGNLDGTLRAGISLRNDQSKENELSHTLNRSSTLNLIQLGNINETNLGTFLGTTIEIDKWTFNPSVRLDYFNFQYNDALLTTYQTQTETKLSANPKFNILYNQSPNLQLYLKTGRGFHSNDTRVVVNQKGHKILPAAYGFDGGFIWKPIPKMFVNAAYWYLSLEQEFVYVGDAGIVEPSGKTRRQGVDLSFRYQPFNWIFWNVDANYTHARTIEEETGQDYIPLAPAFTLAGSINVIHQSGFYGSTHVRHLADRPANEDNTIVAEGHTVTDLNLGYNWKNADFGIQIQNLFNTAWNETQFATNSRLQHETTPVEEIHFTPGTPFFIKGLIEYRF